MQLQYGSYAWPANGVDVRARSRAFLNDAGDPVSFITEFDVEGWIVGNGQAAITAGMISLIAACHTPFQNLKLLQDNGAPSATVLLNAGSIGGVVCTSGPDFLENMGAEYANQRKFRATFKAEYPLNGTQLMLLSWTEQITLVGNGGPKLVVLEALNTPPVEQITYQFTKYRAIQTGRAVGYLQYPPTSLAQPFDPVHLINDTAVIAEEAPQRKGSQGNQGFPLSWKFDYVSATPLNAVPRAVAGRNFVR